MRVAGVQLADARHEVDARAVLEPEVDHRVGRLDGVGDIQPFLQAFAGIDLKATALHRALQATAQGRVIVDQHQDRRLGAREAVLCRLVQRFHFNRHG
jgi:hypothetical protein